ncbi:hypothetical protein QYF36_006437 [Acer negundo]|nr:hypothetical protein QYF36_006437 [Acer negundo]
MILVDEADKDEAIPFVIPSAIVGKEIGNKILTCSQPAPRVAVFSLKGPNALTLEILKPDVSAPGLNILAAWSPADGKMQCNILSGTSLACPHVTGIATLIKAVHLSWSPSAIKSAIMTTGSIIDKNYKPITVDPEGKGGKPRSIYKAVVSPPIGINVTVVPKQLIFNRYEQKMNFTVNFKLTAPAEGYGSGFLSWRSFMAGPAITPTWFVTQVCLSQEPSSLGVFMKFFDFEFSSVKFLKISKLRFDEKALELKLPFLSQEEDLFA